MALAMMSYLAWQGRSIWTNADLIAAMWYGERVADGTLTVATLVGMATHFITSALMGMAAVPFISGLPRWKLLLNSLSYAVASYPLVFATIMIWADPIMFRNAAMLPMTVMHAIFGIAFGLLYSTLEPAT